MNKEFIPYEQALELKELGFDEPCIAFYEPDNNEVKVVGVEQRYNDPTLLRITDFCAPLYQQAFRWFREKHGLSVEVGINYYKDRKYGSGIFYLDEPSTALRLPYEHDTHEEAELACLKKLIEIVKNK